LREEGRLRLWFAATQLGSANAPHTLHDSTSTDGVIWSEPSEALLRDVYAPTVIREGSQYRMWYVDVSREPWCIRHARSADGIAWEVTNAPVLRVDQAWEARRLFYPTVAQVDGAYVMWYGSYNGLAERAAGRDGAGSKGEMHTALGVAVSTDGLHWQKSAHNPIFGPEPSHPWESHYTTSQSILRLADDAWRIWYAARGKPPFHHKYLAIGTAHWDGRP
jgi:predicted GH43/DUF377 family glycosyl hydrolase